MSAVFSCREAAKLASQAQDRVLPMRQHMALRMHTMMCAACRAYERQIIFIDTVFRLRAQHGTADLPTSAGLDAAARERIRARLTQDQ